MEFQKCRKQWHPFDLSDKWVEKQQLDLGNQTHGEEEGEWRNVMMAITWRGSVQPAAACCPSPLTQKVIYRTAMSYGSNYIKNMHLYLKSVFAGCSGDGGACVWHFNMKLQTRTMRGHWTPAWRSCHLLLITLKTKNKVKEMFSLLLSLFFYFFFLGLMLFIFDTHAWFKRCMVVFAGY